MAKLSRQDIMERFEEAVYVAKRLPPVMPAGYCLHRNSSHD